MIAEDTRGAFASNPAQHSALTGRRGAGIARAEGTPSGVPASGSASAARNGQPSARHLAQMRGAAFKAGLSAEFADLMAETGVSAAQAEAVASGLAEFQKVSAPFVQGEQLDHAALMSIAKRAAMAGLALPETDAAAITKEIARVAANEAMALMASNEPPIRPCAIGIGQEAPSRADAMADGLLARMQSGHVPTHGREFANMRLDDLARLSAGSSFLRGQRHAVMWGGAMGADDFKTALAIASNKVLLAAYEAAESQIKKASREVSAPDFRPINTVRVSGGVELAKVLENGEFGQGQITDAGEAFVLETYGKIFTLTRQAIVNDDLRAFEQSSRLFGQGAALTEARIFAGLLEANGGAGPAMSDGKTLFHAGHGNLAETGAALSIGSLSLARTAMRRQKGLAGEAIRVDPALLIVPPELETQAERLVAEISAASADDVNPFQQKLTVLADANLTDPAAWYIAALPGRPDALQHAYLDGASGPQIFTRDGFETDASEFKVRLDFGAGFVDHRAWYKNPGA
ncbi:Mu-like prophage major head subunit gpT family protein [Rhodovulum sp. MB263]|uniref:phage major capsid protein n=1 Tax=Rhodovulum sp. (strain MB263) TaxID=308754 RepID=UPI0009B734A7|nr:Mu-like prophage major head subunit gpT family protein [Rhodovulum sp. MB263]ARC87898.1 hypothetical protein B5V46_04330 [Rhodovulum sp. MB263]